MSIEFDVSTIEGSFFQAWQPVDARDIPKPYQRYINERGLIRVSILKHLGMPVGIDAVRAREKKQEAFAEEPEQLLEAQLGGETLTAASDVPSPDTPPAMEKLIKRQSEPQLLAAYTAPLSMLTDMTVGQEYQLPSKQKITDPSEKQPAWTRTNMELGRKNQRTASRGHGRYSGRH